MVFTEGKYRLRNGVEINITNRHHGWGLECFQLIPELGDTVARWHGWVITPWQGHYKGDYATLFIWDREENPVREHYKGKPLPQPLSAYDILEKL